VISCSAAYVPSLISVIEESIMSTQVEVLRSAPTSRWMRDVLIGGAVGGLADFLFATISAVNGGAPWMRPWKGVAGGLFGMAAMQGGVGMAILGIAFHFLICIVGAMLLYFIASRLKWIPKHWITLGILYGIALLAVMNYVILPLSAIGRAIYPLSNIHVTAFFHILLVGWPTAFFVCRAFKAKS
jgi:hypothetical protein